VQGPTNVSQPPASSVRPAAELNEAAIRAAQPGDTLRDAKIAGLHLRCFPLRKSFYLYFRTKGGQERKPKLGDWGSITLAQAREAARSMLAEVAAGKDPMVARADQRNEPTLADLWDEYWKRHGSKKKSSRDDLNLWNTRLRATPPTADERFTPQGTHPRLGARRLSEIGYSQVADLHDAITKEGHATRANRLLAMLSKMFSFAHRPLKWVADNPCHGVARNQEKRRKRYMGGEEAAKIAEILHREREKNRASVAFIYLLILTGARCSEIAKAKWSMVRGNTLVLAVHKTDRSGEDRVIHLPQAAVDVLDGLPRAADLTITGIGSPRKLWEKIRTEAGCPDLRLHDLRHSFASAAISAGLTLAQIGELLGHQSTQTTKRYAHLVEEAASAAATATADILVARMRLPA